MQVQYARGAARILHEPQAAALAARYYDCRPCRQQCNGTCQLQLMQCNCSAARWVRTPGATQQGRYHDAADVERTAGAAPEDRQDRVTSSAMHADGAIGL